MKTAPEVYQFFGYWQIVVCLFAFTALMAIWRHFASKQPIHRQDKGLVWLALSVLVWAFSGILEIMYGLFSLTDLKEEIIINSGRSMLSIANSAFILLSLPYFKHKPNQESLRQILTPRPWTFWVLLISGIFLILTLLFTGFIYRLSSNESTELQYFLVRAIHVMDVFYAFLTLAMLGLVLWNSFDARNLRILSILTLTCILFTVTAQVFKILEYDFWGMFFSCTFKTMLIMIFLALTLSWVAEALEEEFLPHPHHIMLRIPPVSNGKKQHIYLHLPPNITHEPLLLNATPFNLLQKFAQRRSKEAPDGGWLKMKPKGMDTKHDISSYNQMKSIFKEILNHQHGKDNWSNHDLNYIRKALIEKHPQKDGYYRLRMIKDNIDLNATL